MLTVNILVILAEVIAISVFFYLLNWTLSKLLKPLNQVSWLKLGTRDINKLRRQVRSFLSLSFFLSFLLVVGINGLLMYRGENLLEYTRSFIGKFPREFWIELGTGIAQSIGIIVLTSLSIRPLHRLLDAASLYAQQVDKIKENDAPIEIWFNFLKKHLTNGIWLFALWSCTHFWGLPAVIPQYLRIFLLSYAIIVVGLLTVKATGVLVNTLDGLSDRYSRPDNLLRFYPDLRHLIPLLRRCLEFAIYTCTGTLVVGLVEPIAFLAAYGTVIIKIIGIIFLSRVFIETAHLIAEELLLKNKTLTEEQTKKRQTILPLLQSGLKYLIFFGTGIAILDTIGVDPTPILAAAGILGLAVGLGAQNLIEDIVSGFFILFENYYLVGDEIEVGDIEGVVEAIDLRTTRIRHDDGQLCIIRNGQVTNIVNYSKQYVYAVVEVGVSYEANLDRVFQIIEDIGKCLKEHYSEVTEPTFVDGVESFREYDILIRTLTKVKPGTHEEIQRIARKLIKEAFDKEGIEIPHARRVVVVKSTRDILN